MRRTTIGAKATIVFAGSLFLPLILNVLFLTSIKDFSSGYQEDYIVDAYFYMYLGDQALSNAGTEGTSLFAAADSIRPNISSVGIVYLNALLASVMPSKLVVTFYFWAIYLVLIVLLIGTGWVNWKILLLPLSGLMPYLFVPSKEAFFVLGILMLSLAYLDRRYWIVALPGAASVFLARPEGFYLLAAAWLVWKTLKSGWLSVCLLAALVAVYVYVARDYAFAFATLFQETSERLEVSFCQVGPLTVCVESVNNLELVFAQRVATIALIPFKWGLDLASVFTSDGIEAVGVTTRLFNVIHLGVLLYVALTFERTAGRAAELRGWLTTFGVIYGLAYVAVLYFQPSRQLLLATTMVLIALCISRAPREGVREAAPARRDMTDGKVRAVRGG